MSIYIFSLQTTLNKLIMVSMNLTLPPSSNELNCCINNVESFYFMHGQFHIDFPLQDCYYYNIRIAAFLFENLCLMGVHFISKSSRMDLDSVIYTDFRSMYNCYLQGVTYESVEI